jgi:Cell division protein FtsA.
MGQEPIFALDIGTRTLVGLILEMEGEKYRIKKAVIREHRDRSMLDGQIHDVGSVAERIREVKEEIEKEYGPLESVYVAAAGRSLKTEQARASIDIGGKLLKKEDIIHLELMAVQNAESQLIEKNAGLRTKYYCVGYSVLYSYLDGDVIGNLLNQHGQEASVEIIATFLPKIVIDSLTMALELAGLRIAGLTLEPIAAINLLIPPSMRRLNIALVDIGAGTSDIAITDSGTIVNYGMVEVAGDEITEAVSDRFLLDFPDAEQVKKRLIREEEIRFTDILGFEQTYRKEEILSEIDEAIDKLAERISGEILRLNSLKPPKAVMLVGGGSLTPGLPARLAEKLNLPANRVAVRGLDAIPNLERVQPLENSPEFVTPVGIGIAAKQNPIRYQTVHVNGIPVRLFELKTLTVGECLVQAGIKLGQLFGKPGLAKIITINGKGVTIPGRLGDPPRLMKNGIPCSIDDPVRDGDEIVAEKGKDGAPPAVTLGELVQGRRIRFTLDGEAVEYEPAVTVNGAKKSLDYVVQDRDEILLTGERTIADVLTAIGKEKLIRVVQPFYLFVNGEKKSFPAFSGKLLKNGHASTLKDTVNEGDDIRIIPRKQPTASELARAEGGTFAFRLSVTFNGEPVELVKHTTAIYRNGQRLEENSLLSDGDVITIEQKHVEPFLFQDVFRFVHFSIPHSATGNYELLRNGKPATFHDVLEDGDQLAIRWPDSRNREQAM